MPSHRLRSVAGDVTRVIRPTGSINSKARPADRVVCCLWANPWTSFHRFADLERAFCAYQPTEAEERELLSFVMGRAVANDDWPEVQPSSTLPRPTTPVSTISEARVRRTLTPGTKRPRPALTTQSLNEVIAADIERLRVHRHGSGPLPPGSRDLFVFWAANYLSLTTHVDALPDALERLRDRLVGDAWTDRQFETCVSAVVKRSRMAAAGETISSGGSDWDPRYTPKIGTLIAALGITPQEMAGADLRILLTQDLQKVRRADRQAAYQERRTGKKRSATHADRRASRRALFDAYRALARIMHQGGFEGWRV